jgi:hypothetical protein
MRPKSEVQKSIERRQQQRLLRWARREKFLQQLKDNGIPFEQPQAKGPGAGVAYVDSPSGKVCIRLATGVWTVGDASGQGFVSLLNKVKANG